MDNLLLQGHWIISIFTCFHSVLRVLIGMSIKAVGYADHKAVPARSAYEVVLRNLAQEALKVTEALCRDKSLCIQGERWWHSSPSRRYKI